jgi:ankyrin repeat protein
MKKVLSTVLIAAIGGVSAVLIEKQFSSNNTRSQLLDYKNETPVHFAANYGSVATASGVDFTAAARNVG